jgi:aspartyl-tRNA(Asn)/glutamyl-tRNA(Gln) amidotransferase subunit A
MGRLARAREVSPVELVEAHLARIERLNPELGAFITITADEALREAREAERELAAGNARGPLHGVPYALKDIFATRGVRTTAGSRALAEWIPDQDATTVRLLRAAGAILLGKVNTHEFAFGVSTGNALARTCNPWDYGRIPGGSSGGSGASVAAGLIPFSLGSDTAGSIRIPAALCGVVGLKPTYGRVSCHGVIAQSWTADHVGPLARSVGDAAAVLQVIAGFDPLDYSTSRQPVPDFSTGPTRGVEDLRIGVPVEVRNAPMADDVRQAFDRAHEAFTSLGARVIDVSIPSLRGATDVNAAIILPETTVMHEERLDTQPDEYGEDVRDLLYEGLRYSPSDYIRATDARQRLRWEIEGALVDEVDLLLTPGAPIEAPEIGAERVSLDGLDRPLGTTLIRFLAPFSLTGFPALALPAGLGAHGLPVGIQLIGPAFAERELLAAGAAFERATGWASLHPAIA